MIRLFLFLLFSGACAVPVAILAIICLVYTVSGSFQDDLFDCLQDSDYSELLDIVENGLPPTKTPHHVAIIGGGMSGLTAAKFLEDAGHKVQQTRSVLRQPA